MRLGQATVVLEWRGQVAVESSQGWLESRGPWYRLNQVHTWLGLGRVQVAWHGSRRSVGVGSVFAGLGLAGVQVAWRVLCRDS